MRNRTNSTTRTTTNSRSTIPLKASGIKRKLMKNYKLMRILLLVLVFGILVWSFFTLRLITNKIADSVIFISARNFILQPQEAFWGESGRVNVLILGINELDPTTPDLSDTILVASIPQGPGKIALISVPRDLWIPSLGDRINSAYHWGNQKMAGNGTALAQSTVEQVLGLPINNIIIFNSDSFKQAIDIVGGVDVNVVNSFTDTMYPITGKANDNCNGDPLFSCRYMTIQFTKGITHMNGETALEFVRSRHAAGIEGSDLAREARQQLVLLALKNKLGDKKIYTNPKIVLGLIGLAKSSIITNLTLPQMAFLARRVLDVRQYANYLVPQELLITPPAKHYYGAIVFIPKAGDGNWSEIQKWVQNVLQ